MGEHFNPEEYNDYQHWKRERELPVPKAGDSVRVPRSDGTVDEIEEGWKIKFIFPDENGQMIASLTNEGAGISKELPLNNLAEYNED
jgi:hypothetical protein